MIAAGYTHQTVKPRGSTGAGSPPAADTLRPTPPPTHPDVHPQSMSDDQDTPPETPTIDFRRFDDDHPDGRYTVADIEALVAAIESRETLTRLLTAEEDTFDRKTAKAAIEARLDAVGGPEPPTGHSEQVTASDTADSDADSDSGAATDDATTATDDPDAADADGGGEAATPDRERTTTQVTVRAPGTGYYGGEWFDAAGTKNTEWSPRLEAEVRDGDLTLVAARHETVIPDDLLPDRQHRPGTGGR